MLLKKLRLVYFFLFTFFINCSLFGQQAQTQFGKNRIQYKAFNWQYISTYNFDIYYYDEGKEIAKNAATWAETDMQKVIDMTGFSPYSKVKLIVFNSASDMQQSNIGLNDGLLIGGQTNFVKSKIEVAFKGNQIEFRKDINYAVSKMVIDVMLYGGSLKEIVQSSYLLSLPEWFAPGAAAFISEGWSIEMDNFMRDFFVNRKIKKPSLLSGNEARIVGQSIWNFIGDKYGKSNIVNILNLTRILRNEEASIESTLGIPYSLFMREWRIYYGGMAQEAALDNEKINNGNRITKRKYKDEYYKNLTSSPDGKFFSYIKNHRGKYDLYLYNTENGSKKRIHSGGRKLLNLSEDKNVLIASWQSSEVLAFIEKKNHKTFLNFYDLKKGKTIKRTFKGFDQILSFSFSNNGEKMVLSASNKGQSDLFIYEFKDNVVRQLTNDIYDDLYPAFLINSSSVAFTSNRVSDTLNKDYISFTSLKNAYNIFLLEESFAKSVKLKRITYNGESTKPSGFDKENILYLSDESGIRSLMKYNLKTKESVQISKFLLNIENYTANKARGTMVFSALEKGKEGVFLYPDFDFNTSFEPVFTERKMKIVNLNPKIVKSNKNNLSKTDSTKSLKEEGPVNLNDYHFESDINKEKKPKEIIPAVSANKHEVKMAGPLKYKNSFGVERVNSTLKIDPLRGLGILMEANMADMMGNHRMNAGLFALTDLKSSSLFGEYLYLKNRVDFKARYDRSTIFAYDEINQQRYTLNKLALTASYPISETSRLSLTPSFMGTNFTNLGLNSSAFFSNDISQTYFGLKSEYVFDNSVVTGLNMLEGTRCKISFENNFNSRDANRNFGMFNFDLRHYQPIHREIVLATRLAYGEFFGSSKKNFLLGGMDNWLLNSTTRHNSNDPLALSTYKDNSDLLFVEYVTNLRGFNYNAQFGNKYVLLNAEVRVPIVKYLYKGIVNSSFLKNLQFVSFTDVGSAWSGKNPFNTDNSTNTNFIGGGSSPFSAKVINYQSPFLIGYGVGVRTMFLGYYAKVDMAWGVLDNVVQSRKFYLTFGYDF